MRMSDIALQLQNKLPFYTDVFHDVFDVSLITASATQAVVTTTKPNNVQPGTAVNISGVETRTPIQSVSTDGFSHTFVTSLDHDLTFGDPNYETVLLEGFTDAPFNAPLRLLAVPNRRTFVVASNPPSPTLNGNEILLEKNRLDNIDGSYEVISSSSNTFTIEGDFLAGVYTPVNGKVSTSARVGVAADMARAEKLYDECDDFWMYVIPEAARASKDRSSPNDAMASFQSGNNLRLKVLDAFSLFIFAPVTKQLAAEEALDICRHDLFPAILASIYGLKVDTGLACETSEFQIVFTDHEVFSYNEAVLVYMYSFQLPFDITTEDAVKQYGSRAFRDVSWTNPDLHIPPTLEINLDEDPL